MPQAIANQRNGPLASRVLLILASVVGGAPAIAEGGGRGTVATALARPPQQPEAAAGDNRPEGLEIRGKVVDIETGRPIGNFIVQRGVPDPGDPDRTIWGSGEGRTWPNPAGSLEQTLNERGEWARILAPGYVPQPITEKPYDGHPGRINVTVKLRRGWRIAGRVLDASRKPVAGASVFLVGGRMGPNITGGKATDWIFHGQLIPNQFLPGEDDSFTKAVTDKEGRFTLNSAGGYETAIAVSAPGLDFWLHEPVPPLGKSCEIVLPAPGKLTIRYAIEGGEPEATVSLSRLDYSRAARNERDLTIPNGGQLVLENLAPGSYRVQRSKVVRIAQARRSPRLEARDVVIESGKASQVALVRKVGAAVEGEIVGLEKLELPGALIYLVKPEELRLIELNRQVNEAVEALSCDASGRFKTPRLPPGTYSIVVDGYEPRPLPAAHRALGTVTVPERGPAPRVRIVMPDPPPGKEPAADRAGRP